MEEKFKVVFHRDAKKVLNNKFKNYKDEILKEIKRLKINPFFSKYKDKIKKIKINDKSIYRLKFSLPDGSCRCIYKVYKKENVCLIREIGYRENITTY